MIDTKHLRKNGFSQMALFEGFSVFCDFGLLVKSSQMYFWGKKLATFAKNEYFCIW